LGDLFLQDQVVAAVEVLRATGVPLWDAAMTLVQAGLDRAAVASSLGIPARALADLEGQEPLGSASMPQPQDRDNIFHALIIFGRIGKGDPLGACAALNAYLTDRELDAGVNLGGSRWVTHLPDTLRRVGDLDLQSTSITALPANLKVIDLRLGASLIRSLPKGLEVDSMLDLRHCAAWDGRIPEDARVGEGLRRPGAPPAHQRVFTDRHFAGITLAAWRRLHPQGEREDGLPPTLAGKAPGGDDHA
jgi:hypothetical protein